MFPHATTHFTRFCRAKHMGPGPTIASMALSADVAVEALVLFEATVQHLRLVFHAGQIWHHGHWHEIQQHGWGMNFGCNS